MIIKLYFQRKFTNQLSGLTLVEVMLYTALFSMISVSFISLLLMIANFETRFRIVAELDRTQAQYIDELRSLAFSSANIISPMPGASSNQLVLTDRTGDLQTIGLNENRIYLSRNGTQTWLTGPTVKAENLSFTCIFGKGVKMSVEFGSLAQVEPDLIEAIISLKP